MRGVKTAENVEKNANLPGNLLISNDSWRFSSYDIGLAVSSSSESNCGGGTFGFFLFAPRGVAGLLALPRLAAGPVYKTTTINTRFSFKVRKE